MSNFRPVSNFIPLHMANQTLGTVAAAAERSESGFVLYYSQQGAFKLVFSHSFMGL